MTETTRGATVVVRIPTPLRSFAGGRTEIEVVAPTVRAALAEVGARHEGLRERVLRPDGELREFVNVFVGSVDVRRRDGLETPLEAGDVLSILPAVAGGGP